MPVSELQALRFENSALRAELRLYTGARRPAAAGHATAPTQDGERLLLLRMAEGLVDAHRAAKVEADVVTLDLIQDALFHVGGRLARSSADDPMPPGRPRHDHA